MKLSATNQLRISLNVGLALLHHRARDRRHWAKKAALWWLLRVRGYGVNDYMRNRFDHLVLGIARWAWAPASPASVSSFIRAQAKSWRLSKDKGKA